MSIFYDEINLDTNGEVDIINITSHIFQLINVTY